MLKRQRSSILKWEFLQQRLHTSENPIRIGSIILWNIYKFSYVPIKISHQVPYLIIIHTNQFYSLRRKNIPYLSIFYLTSHFLLKSPEIYVTVNFFPNPTFFSIPCYYFFTLLYIISLTTSINSFMLFTTYSIS